METPSRIGGVSENYEKHLVRDSIVRNYSLRFSLLPSLDFEKRVGALLDFCEKALVDDVMFFIAVEELHVGHITLEEAKKYTDVILRAKKILAERGITVSLNPWCTLAHYDGGRKLKKGQDFRTMVGNDGTKAELVVCPLCENWREYYVELLNFYVETLQPKILWFEDDLRMSNHEPVALGCFCDEHMKLFNERAGTDYDRATFVQKIRTDKNVRKAYLDTQAYNVEDLLSYITERVQGQKTFGLMTGSAGQQEGRKNARLFSILSGGDREKPYNRMCLNSYRQRGMQEYAWAINESSMLARKLTGDHANCVSEIENFPHSMYTKSANYLRYQMLSTSAMGLVGDTFSIFEFNGNGAVNYDKYAKVLREIKPYLSKLDKLGLTPDSMVGVNVLVSENSSYTIEGNGLFPFDGWLFAYLEQIGVACAYTTEIAQKGKIVAASGQVLRNFTKEEICALFENNFVILTGDNVEALKDIGLLSLIGAEDCEIWAERTGKYAMEELSTGEELFGVERLRATAQFFCGDHYHIRYGNAPRKTYTQMIDHEEKTVGEGICAVGNALIFPYANTRSDQRVPISLICPLREYVVKKALSENPVTKENLFFVREENVCMYAFDKGDTVYMVCMNFVDDDYDKLHFESTCPFEDVKIFTPDNASVRSVAYVCENGKYTINHALKAQQCCVLVGYKRTNA